MYKRYVLAIATLLFLFSTGSATAQTANKEFPAESLETRLAKIAQESKINILFDATNQIKELKVPALNGTSKTWEQILEASLEATGFTYKKNGSSYAIVKKPAPAPKKKPGKITGKVVDNTALSLPGATIRVLETGLTILADSDGNYTLSLEPGTYTVEASFISFQTQKITGVAVSENATTPLNIALKEDSQTLQEVVVTQTYQKATASVEGMLLQQKKAAQFSDGISAEQIARTPDRDVASSLKRITGVTTVGDKYVVVRSMGERWNQAVMDGITLPSTDAYQQNFSFDIIPTSIVESIVVSKSATPDMYANFAGGYVEIQTKAIPKENFTNFSISTSYNSQSTFKERLTKQEGDYDYLGFDDGRRDFPSAGTLTAENKPDFEADPNISINQSKRFTEDNFTTYKTYGAPGTTLQFGIGRTYKLKDNNKWGFVGSLIFKNTQEKLDIEHTERGSYLGNSVFSAESETKAYSTFTRYGFKNSGASYNYNSTLGGMFNAAIELGDHKITVRNTAMHIYSNQLTRITGWQNSVFVGDVVDRVILPGTSETNYPVYTTFIQSKVEGKHNFDKLEVNWYGAATNVAKDTKDATFLDFSTQKIGDDELVGYGVYNSGERPGRSNFTNDEINYNAAINFKYPFNFSDSFTNVIKAGYFGTYKKATNQQVTANLENFGTGSTDATTIYGSLASFLDGSNYYYGGYGWFAGLKYGNQYVGDVKVHSPFAMLDNKLGNTVRLVWGVRAESYLYTQIESQSTAAGDFVQDQEDKLWQFLPSASLIISPTNKMNVRLGYNKSVLRPQFAERLSIPYFDPIRSLFIYNYTNGVVSSVANNYDFKMEWFPSNGEILSFGVYHKDIDNPIEGVGALNTSGARNVYNMNSVNAKLWGVELEFYKSLSFLGEGETLKDLFIYGNATVNATKVVGYEKIDGTGGLYEANRPLYGQSPYSYNFGLDYVGERLGFSLRHNAVGDQYILVGFDYGAEEIRKPYGITDAQVSYKFFKERNLELKCSLKNLLDTGIETYNNLNSYSKNVPSESTNPRERWGLGAGATDKFDENLDQEMFKAKNGRTISLSVSYSF